MPLFGGGTEMKMAEEKIIIGEGGPWPLNGILSLPGGAEGPVPAVILVHGSGSSDMDEKIFKNRPFRDLAEGLTARGIAVIRYDKRSFVHGRKLVKNRSFTVYDETIEDAILAAALLRSDPRIDKNKVFMIGHSMGGMLAPRIDAMGGDFAGLIIMAGTLRKLEEVMFGQIDEMIADANPLMRFLIKKQEKSLRKKFAGLYEIDDEKAKEIKIMGGASAYYFKEMGLNDAPSYLAKMNKPILVLHGGKDCQVSESDFEMYKELLGDRDNAAFRLYPELNHLFMPSVYGTLKKVMKEYKIKSRVADVVMDDIAEWIFEVSKDC